MSRFFTGSDSDSDSESGSSDHGSELDQEEEKHRVGKYMYDSSSDEEEKRVVRSEKDKRWEEMQNTTKTLKNQIKINDWMGISASYDLLLKQIEKAKNVTRKEGIPKFWIHAILLINENIQKQEKGDSKNKSNNKALNTMRQKIRKTLKQFEKQIEAYNKDPYVEKTEEEMKKKKKAKKAESSDDESSESEIEEAKPKATKKKKVADSDDSDADSDADDDEEEGDDSEEDWSDDESDDDEDDAAAFELNSKDIFKREFWVKKVEEDAGDKKKGKARVQKQGKQKKVEEPKKEEPKRDEKTYTPEIIMKKMKEVQLMRGKKGTDRNQVVADLTLLATKATTPVVMLKVKITLAAALFDSVMNTVKYMPQNIWQQCAKCLMDMITILTNNKDVRLSEDEEVEEAFEDDDDSKRMTMEALMESRETKEKREEEAKKKREEEMKAGGIQYVMGNLYALVQRMSAEFRSSLQNIDPHTPEYVTRLVDEPELIQLIAACFEYYNTVSEKPLFARQTAMLWLELLYYHYDEKTDELGKDNTQEKNSKSKVFIQQKFGPEAIAADTSKVCDLAKYLYKNGDDQEKTRALLCHVYYLALHNKYRESRDLLLMSHVQDQINDADPNTRILFNRSMAQLGLCAFRVNDARQALFCLADLYQTNKVRELLAQGGGNNRYNERDEEKEKRDKKRQYPFHMHVNLDVLEAAHLLSAMFTEVPNLAQYGSENRRKAVSKYFRRLLEHHKNKAFNGPPENTRDCVMSATVALQEGDWKKALVSVKKLKIWALIPMKEKILGQIEDRLKEVCLRTYLLTYGQQYRAVASEDMEEMFEMSSGEVYKIISKMIINWQLQGAWDQPSKCVIMHKNNPSRLQKAAIAFSDKAALFVEQNERLLEQRYGYYQGGDNNNNNRRGGGGGGGNWNNNQGGGGNNYNNNRNYNNNNNSNNNNNYNNQNNANFGNFRTRNFQGNNNNNNNQRNNR